MRRATSRSAATSPSTRSSEEGASRLGAPPLVHSSPSRTHARCYSLMTHPSDFGSVGSVVLPIVMVTPPGPAFTTSARPPVGGVPSPMSSVLVPLSVTEPSGFDVPLVIQPVMVIHWLRPMRLVPVYWASRAPFAEPVLEI